jgi:mediator of RNA polymerase II transcription subunit 13
MAFQRAASGSFGLNTVCNLVMYASIFDVIPDQSKQPRTGLPKHPVPSTRSDVNISGMTTIFDLTRVLLITITGHPIRLPVPHIRVRRNDNLWDLLSPAIPFWETLGLAPAGGPKNLETYTIYPLNDDLKSYAGRFMSELGISYEVLKLGTHTRGTLLPEADSDLVPWNLPQSFTPDDVKTSLCQTCMELGKALAAISRVRFMKSQQSGPWETIVIYIINPFDGFPAFSTIVSGFWTLFNTYRKSVSPSFHSRQADLVLQIIPISFVADPDQIVVSQSPSIHNLAREVYNRCPPASQNPDPAGLSIYPATSIQLSEALPRKISFELTADPPSNIMHENSQLHVGYARSKSGNWVTAAYTDNTGRYQAVVSYCLSGSRTFSEVAEEIWQTSLDIMQARRVNWRLCISKAGLMENEELTGKDFDSLDLGLSLMRS